MSQKTSFLSTATLPKSLVHILVIMAAHIIEIGCSTSCHHGGPYNRNRLTHNLAYFYHNTVLCAALAGTSAPLANYQHRYFVHQGCQLPSSSNKYNDSTTKQLAKRGPQSHVHVPNTQLGYAAAAVM